MTIMGETGKWEFETESGSRYLLVESSRIGEKCTASIELRSREVLGDVRRSIAFSDVEFLLDSIKIGSRFRGKVWDRPYNGELDVVTSPIISIETIE